jgi:hypothetical protein
MPQLGIIGMPLTASTAQWAVPGVRERKALQARAQMASPAANPMRRADVRAKASASVAASWRDAAVVARRRTHHCVVVTGGTLSGPTQYRSARAAFRALALPEPAHEAFRLRLKALGEQAIGGYQFRLAPSA